jgi:hypothetical protein
MEENFSRLLTTKRVEGTRRDRMLSIAPDLQRLPEHVVFCFDFRIFQSRNSSGENGGVFRARFSDGDTSHGGFVAFADFLFAFAFRIGSGEMQSGGGASTIPTLALPQDR